MCVYKNDFPYPRNIDHNLTLNASLTTRLLELIHQNNLFPENILTLRSHSSVNFSLQDLFLSSKVGKPRNSN